MKIFTGDSERLRSFFSVPILYRMCPVSHGGKTYHRHVFFFAF